MDDEFFAMMDIIENTLKSDSGSDGKSSSSFYEDDEYDEGLDDDVVLFNVSFGTVDPPPKAVP